MQLSEIKQLQELVTEVEQSVDERNKQIKNLNEKNQLLSQKLTENNAHRSVGDERVELKIRELQQAQEETALIEQQLQEQARKHQETERQLIKIKASEFDKVDQMKLNVELDSKVNKLFHEAQEISEVRDSEQARANQQAQKS